MLGKGTKGNLYPLSGVHETFHTPDIYICQGVRVHPPPERTPNPVVRARNVPGQPPPPSPLPPPNQRLLPSTLFGLVTLSFSTRCAGGAGGSERYRWRSDTAHGGAVRPVLRGQPTAELTFATATRTSVRHVVGSAPHLPCFVWVSPGCLSHRSCAASKPCSRRQTRARLRRDARCLPSFRANLESARGVITTV